MEERGLAERDEAFFSAVAADAFVWPAWLTRRAALALGLLQVVAGVAGLSYASRWYGTVQRMVEVRGVVVAASAPKPVTQTSAEQTIVVVAPHRDDLYKTTITLRVPPDEPVPLGKGWRCTLVPGDPESLRGGTLSMHRTGPIAALAVSGLFALLGLGFLFSVVFRPG